MHYGIGHMTPHPPPGRPPPPLQKVLEYILVSNLYVYTTVIKIEGKIRVRFRSSINEPLLVLNLHNNFSKRSQ